MAFAKTAVLNKSDNTLIKLIETAEEKKEFDGRDDVVFMTKKTFSATEQFQSWDEMSGKVKPVSEEDEKAAEGKPARSKAPSLSGPYHLVKPLPACPEDHPKKPIWDAIAKHQGGTVEEAIADCPKENPKRKTSGVYTFASEFRYFLKTGYAAMGEIPEGYDYTKYEKPVKAKKEKQETAGEPAKNESAEEAKAE